VSPAGGADELLLLGDIGSTFVKLIAVDEQGRPTGQLKLPTTHGDIAEGVARGCASLQAQLSLDRAPSAVCLSSSAGGGLRVVVVGFERELTLKAALRASATAGARIVGVYTTREFQSETAEGLNERTPDLVLLTGGTDGGDTESIVRSAKQVQRLVPAVPVVVAGNEQARDAVRAALGNGRPVELVGNVMPRIGTLDTAPAQRAIRELFISHVIGQGRFASASAIAGWIRLPTPAAVLAGARAIADLAAENASLAYPAVVDVGGATTDVHSVMPAAEDARGYVNLGLPDQAVTRTVEGDLGVRENAESLVEAAVREGYAMSDEREVLEAAAQRRSRERDFVPSTEPEARIDERLAELAGAIAIHRHAGVLRTSLTPAGAELRRTGRDLRDASCLVLTGGVFQHTRRPGVLGRHVLRQAHAHGALIREDLPIFRDRAYLLWAAGLIQASRGTQAVALARATLEEVVDE
jgi:uncharacterized protein (TIGR01319 family)